MSFQELPFLDVFKDATGGNIKTPQTEFLEEGEFPVVDQGQSLVAGFVNDRSRVCSVKPPVIIFGDHTRALKYVDFEFAMGADGTKVLVPKVESDTKYLYYALKAIKIPAAGYSRHYKFLKETQIPLPPLAEQKRIAGILDAADALRAKRREALAQLDTLLQSTFLDMFGDPVTNPMGWKTPALSEVTDEIYRYPTYFGIVYENEGVPEIRGELIGKGGKLDTDPSKLRFIAQATSDKFPRTQLAAGDLVMSVRGTIGKIGIVPAELINANMTANLIRISSARSIIDPVFLLHLALGPYFLDQLSRASSSTTIKTIKSLDLKAIPIQLPPLDLQRRFAAIVESFEHQKASQRAHLAELDTLFASLQSRAFRGDL